MKHTKNMLFSGPTTKRGGDELPEPLKKLFSSKEKMVEEDEKI